MVKDGKTMTKRTYESELSSLLFAYRTNAAKLHHPLAENVRNDLDRARNCRYSDQRGKNLIRGLLIGRSVDTFTVYFLLENHRNENGTFDQRIRRICTGRAPLTTDPTVQADLNKVRELRNELFHKANRHFTYDEMNTFVFKSVKSIGQLIKEIV